MDLYDKDGNSIDEVYDSDGNKIEEALTPEEIDNRIAEAKEEAQATFQKSLEEAQSKLNDKEDLLAQKEEELAKLSNKDTNFGKLKSSKEQEIETLKTQIASLENRMGEVSKVAEDKSISTLINSITGNDLELTKKVKFYYDQFTVPQEDTEEKRNERLKNALSLATGGKIELSSEAISSGVGTPLAPKVEMEGKLSEDAKGVAKNLGIDDKELKKYKLI